MKVLIFGVTGQDGSYLAELALTLGHRVIGISRRVSVDNSSRLLVAKQHKLFDLVEGDITDATSVARILLKYQPDLIFNLAAQSHVGTSFDEPLHTFDATGKSVLNILEAIRMHCPLARFYQASSSEMLGDSHINDLQPKSPYGVAKLAGHHLCRIYREGYGLYTVSGILFNHESPRRGDKFVTQKICNYVAGFIMDNICSVSIKDNILDVDWIIEPDIYGDKLKLGNIESKRDWGHAKDYVKAMWLMMEQDIPQDYVVATGESYSVKDFVKEAFAQIRVLDWYNYVETTKEFCRPYDINHLSGNTDKKLIQLGWKREYTFETLVREMLVEAYKRRMNEQKFSRIQTLA